MQAALARVSKHPERREFKQGYKRLQDLYESVSPDKRLVQPEIKQPYGWLSGVWMAFNRTEEREEDPEESVREKTLSIVEEHVDVGKVKEDFPIYKIGEEPPSRTRSQPQRLAQSRRQPSRISVRESERILVTNSSVGVWRKSLTSGRVGIWLIQRR